MDAVKAAGAVVISYMQNTWLLNYSYNIHRCLYYWTPSFVLTVLCPVLLTVQGTSLLLNIPISATLGLHTMLAALLALRINTFVQWGLADDRPYWWVKESLHYSGHKAPHLRQYPVTCLTSPAGPIHSLLVIVVGAVLMKAALQAITAIKFKCVKKERMCRVALFISFILLVLTVVVGELFFAAHFPHQVLISLLIGAASAACVLKRGSSGGPPCIKKTLLMQALLLAATVGVMYARGATEKFNLYHQLSFRWCERRDWMQKDPAPFMDVFVFTGAALGTTLSTLLRYYKTLNKQRFSIKMVLSLLILNLAAVQTILLTFHFIPQELLHSYAWLNYGSQLICFILLPIVCAALVPYFVQTVSGVSPKSLKQKKP